MCSYDGELFNLDFSVHVLFPSYRDSDLYLPLYDWQTRTVWPKNIKIGSTEEKKTPTSWMQGRTYPLGKGRWLPWAPKSQGPPKMIFIYEMRIKREHANGCCLRCLLPRQPSACPSWTCLCILLVANENIMHLKLTAARGLSFPARAHLSLSLSVRLLCSARG